MDATNSARALKQSTGSRRMLAKTKLYELKTTQHIILYGNFMIYISLAYGVSRTYIKTSSIFTKAVFNFYSKTTVHNFTICIVNVVVDGVFLRNLYKQYSFGIVVRSDVIIRYNCVSLFCCLQYSYGYPWNHKNAHDRRHVQHNDERYTSYIIRVKIEKQEKSYDILVIKNNCNTTVSTLFRGEKKTKNIIHLHATDWTISF